MRKLIIILVLFTCGRTAFPQEEGIIVISTEQQKVEYFFNHAFSSYQQKEYDTALVCLNNVLKINSSMEEAYILKANTQQQMGKVQDAIATWLVFADKIGKKDSAYYMIAKLYYDEKDYSSSLKHTQMAIDINNSNYRTHYLQGLNYYSLEKQEDAINSFTAAITLRETVAELYNDRANAFSKTGNYTQAIEDYTQAIRIKSIASYYSNRANAEYLSGNHARAVEDYTTAIQLDKQNYQLFCSRGVAKLALSDLYEALEDFHTCIQLNNKFSEGYNYRGIVYFKLKRYIDAVNDFNKTISLNPKAGEAYLHRGNTYEMLREAQKACQDWQQAAEMGIEAAKEYTNNQCK